MTVKEVHEWCRKNRIDARGFVRGGEFFIRHGEDGSSTAPSGEILHWQLTIDGQNYPTSTSDLGRLMTGKIGLEDFVKAMAPRPGRSAE
jgi:hypothetical protein